MLVEIRRILFPTDFSAPAKQAQEYAMALAERFGAELHLLHVIPPMLPPIPDSRSSWAVADPDQTLQVEEAKKRLVHELGEQWSVEHRAIQFAMVGFAVDEIVKYAKKHDIDVIVLGTHGHTGLSRLLIGSVAEKVVRLADCPVLTVRPKGHQFLIGPDSNPS